MCHSSLNMCHGLVYMSQFTEHVPWITGHMSQFTEHVLWITGHMSQFTEHVLWISENESAEVVLFTPHHLNSDQSLQTRL